MVLFLFRLICHRIDSSNDRVLVAQVLMLDRTHILIQFIH